MQTLQTKRAAEPQKVAPKVDVARKPAAPKPAAQGFEAAKAALSPAATPLKPATAARAAVKAPPPPQRDLPDPAVVKKDGVADPYAYKKNDRGAVLYGPNGVQVSDVRQGAIGDCYLAAALAAVAGTSPAAITNAIKDNGDGTFTVRFYQLDWTGSKKAESVTVDADLPFSGDLPAYAKSTESVDGKPAHELWPSILEKAYAQWKGSYDAIGHGGNAGDVMEALTGERARSRSTSGDTDALWTKMKEATEKKKPMCAGSGDKDDAKYKDPKAGVYGWHAYTVLGVEEKKTGDKTEKLVRLRNPWSVRRRAADAAAVGDAENKAEFTLTYDEFRRLYDDVYFNG